MEAKEILGIYMQKNDADAVTIRDYLKALLTALWDEGEGFSGKRPLGNSGWERELELALFRGGAIDDPESDQSHELIQQAINAL